MKFSLVLATYGRCEDVAHCLSSLAAQSCKDFEVIVVDQNADDRISPLVEAACQQGLTIRHLRQAAPNLSAARNLGIREARGEIIGFPDDDCWYEPDALNALQEAFSSGADGVLANWVEQTHARGVVPTGELSLAAWRNFRGGDASSISLFFRREVFERLGGFDERFGVGRWYGAAEETDFILRALTASVRMARCTQARVHHHFGGRTDSPLWLTCGNLRRRARGTGALYVRHGLSLFVILRGLVAPWLKPATQARPKMFVQGLWVVLGRLEGMLRWYWKDKK